jgi:hypothetical protein
MFTHLTKEEKAVHYPDDRRMFLGIKPYILVIFAVIIVGMIGAAWLQYLLIGLPANPAIPLTTSSDPRGFPLWISLSHWVNFFFLVLIIRSGLSIYGGVYYDTNTLDNYLKPQSILAWEMNYEALPLIHGAPLRLRVENQPGYKMVKWISSIEFVETHKSLGKGFGGKNEDDEYFDLLADT